MNPCHRDLTSVIDHLHALISPVDGEKNISTEYYTYFEQRFSKTLHLNNGDVGHVQLLGQGKKK